MGAKGEKRLKTAVLVSRFPTVSETFVLFEAVELGRQGLPPSVYTLVHERPPFVHPSAAELDRSSNHVKLVSLEVLRAQLHWLRRRPRAYLGAWATAVRANLRSPGFLARALYVVPVSAALARRMEREGVGHIHAHFATHAALAAWVASRLTGIPYSFTAHAHDLYVDRSMLAEKLRDASFARMVSVHNCRLVERLYGPPAARKLRLVNYGIDTRFFRPGASRTEDGPLRIVVVASLADYKGHEYLLEALHRIRRAGVDFACDLVGEGPLRGDIQRRIARLAIADRVRLLGAQPRDAVRELLDRAHVKVLPSVVTETGKMEGVPNALMEALAMEVPVVTTDISGISELVVDGENGLLVPQRDSGALARALERLARDPELRRRLGAAGRRKVAAEFDLRTNVARLAALIRAEGSETSAPEAESPRSRVRVAA